MEQFVKMFDVNAVLNSAEKNVELMLGFIPAEAVRNSVGKVVDAQFELARVSVEAFTAITEEGKKAVEKAVAAK